jgi:hypothetical protein
MALRSGKERHRHRERNNTGDYGVGRVIACLAIYALVMAGVRFYAQKIGVLGVLLTITGLYATARWYERRQ